MIHDDAALATEVLADAVKAHPKIVASVVYGCCPTAEPAVPVLAHLPVGEKVRRSEGDEKGSGSEKLTTRTYPAARRFFIIPAHADYRASAAAVAHTRSLSFLKPLVGGPYFDLEAIWDEHTRYEFADRSVEETMATMVEEPYVNHMPTLTGGIGRKELTSFYRDHFIFSNPEDASLELVSRTVGVDRVVDEFLFNCTHDRVIDWLYDCSLLETYLPPKKIGLADDGAVQDPRGAADVQAAEHPLHQHRQHPRRPPLPRAYRLGPGHRSPAARPAPRIPAVSARAGGGAKARDGGQGREGRDERNG